MLKYFNYMTIGILFGALSSCTPEQKCKFHNKIVDRTTYSVAQALACENPEALKRHVNKLVSKLHFCDGKPDGIQPMGPISMLVCAPAIDKIFDAGLKAMPADAKCKGGPGFEAAKAVAVGLCQQLPF